MKSAITYLTLSLIGLVFVSCNRWTNTYIQFQDGFFNKKPTLGKAIVLPPEYYHIDNSGYINPMKSLGGAAEFMLLIDEYWMNKFSQLQWADVLAKLSEEEIKQHTRLRQNIIIINNSQNFTNVNAAKINSNSVNRELFAQEPFFLPEYSSLSEKYGTDIFIVPYVYSEPAAKKIYCVVIADLSKNRIVCRVFSGFYNYKDLRRFVKLSGLELFDK
jgi:hypothetical protein